MTRLIWCSLFILASTGAHAQAPAEEAAYSKVRNARDVASRFPTRQAVRHFEQQARAFLKAHPRSRHCCTVHVWLGDQLKETRPREALKEYLRSDVAAGRKRAADMAFRYEAPPPLAVERWIGTPIDPCRTTGDVKVLIFFSDTHPQTRKLLPRILDLHKRFGRKGLAIAGIAAVADDHKSQRPAVLVARLKQRRLPFSVAVDRQRQRALSISLERYRGDFLPWAVFIDRYGRIAWHGGLDLRANTMARAEGKLAELCAQPTYGELARRLKAGDVAALDRLAAIRTMDTASAIVQALKAGPPPAVKARALEILGGLMPRGYLNGDPAAALKRWQDEKGAYRYSFARNRLVGR